MINNQGNYDDIINLKHHVSLTHPRMSLNDRAAQFAPFSALTGYEESIKEVSRLTDKKKELSDDEKMIINDHLIQIQENIVKKNIYEITYFIKDEKKTGGKYLTINGIVKRIDDINKKIIMNDNKKIAFDDILSIKEVTL